MFKYFISLNLLLTLLFQPLSVFAQTVTSPSRIMCADGTYAVPKPNGPGCLVTRCADGTIAKNGQCPNTKETNQNIQRFQPAINVDVGGQNGFNGINFSGVGGAVLGCTNIGSSIVSGVSELFKSSKLKKDNSIKAELAKKIGYIISGGTTEQPVTDQKALEEARKQTQRENCLNGMAYAVAKNTLQQMSNKTFKWINTGYNGNPFYVRDIDSYLKTIQNEQLKNYLDTASSSDPIFGNALKSSITQLVTGRSDGRINLQMNTSEYRAYQDFQGDFTKGGWAAFLDPANNPLGAFFKAADKLANNTNTAQQNVKDELQQGNGFLDMKKCVEYAKSSSGQQGKCLHYETVTPGSMIAAQTAATTTSAIRQAEQADQINEVLGSFFDGLVNRLFAQGLASLSGGGNNINAGFNSDPNLQQNVVLGSNGLPIQNAAVSIEDAFGYQRASGGFFGEFDISRPQQVRAVLKTQKDFYNFSADTQVAMSTIVPSLGKLDYCFPGPNPTWTIGTNYNFEIFMNNIQGKPQSKTLGNTISGLSSAGAAFPGPGTIVAAVGNVVGGLINLATGDYPKSLDSSDLQLLDKVTNSAVQISDYHISRDSWFDDIDQVWFLNNSYQETVDKYEDIFDPEKITQAFVATKIESEADTRAMVDNIYNEIGTLIFYNQAIERYKEQQSIDMEQTKAAIKTLESINEEVERIVSVAKNRYIKERADAGVPVDLRCINEAYNVKIGEVEGTAQLENGERDPMVDQSQKSSVFFYSRL